MTRQKELWPLYKKADLTVRPTCTDGDAVSIRESLLIGCPVVASDVCIRPQGTIMFGNRNQTDLLGKVIEVLDAQSC